MAVCVRLPIFWIAEMLINFALSVLKTFKSSILIFLALLSLSPVLRTLTASTSSDSIWALSAILLLLNAILADYSTLNAKKQLTGRSVFCNWTLALTLICEFYFRLTSVISMNAAVSASAVLASRLTTDIAVFGLMLFSIQAFALFPILRYRFQVIRNLLSDADYWFRQASGSAVQSSLTFGLVLSSIRSTVSLSWQITCLYMLIFSFVTFLAPALLMWAQKYKKWVRSDRKGHKSLKLGYFSPVRSVDLGM